MGDLLASGFTLTVIGMGVVFVLLALLVGVVQATSKLSRLLGGEPAVAPTASAAVTPSAAPLDTQRVDDELAAVVTAAVRMFRSRHGARS